MKLVLIVAALGLATNATAQPTMTSMANMAGAHATMTMAEGLGVVKAVDARAGTVTLHHGPIANLGWPAMTMTFKASPPSLLRNVKTGQSVAFTLMQMGGATALTAITPK